LHAAIQTVLEMCCAGGKLASLEEFRAQRDELISETSQLEATLQEHERIHQAQIYDLEKKQVIEKDRCSAIVVMYRNAGILLSRINYVQFRCCTYAEFMSTVCCSHNRQHGLAIRGANLTQ